MTFYDRGLKELFSNHASVGRLVWIGLRPERRADLRVVDEVQAEAGRGLHGDRAMSYTANGKRQVTLIQAEHLPVIAALLGRAELGPALLRRNLVIAGLNLLALSGQQFTLGEGLFEMTGPCHPCSRMEKVLGPGGYNAMRGHGGITARILRSGRLKLGDQLAWHAASARVENG